MAAAKKQNPANRREALAGQSFPESVIPEAGKPINGVFLRMSVGPTGKYGPAPILIYRPEGSAEGTERSLWLLHTAAKSQVVNARPLVGEGFTFTLLGRRESKASGNEYQDCRFVTDRMVAEAEAQENGSGDPNAAFDAIQASLDAEAAPL